MIPWLLPATMLLRRRLKDPGRRTAADASVAALVEGGWWPAARLATAGLRESPLCACGKAVGTLWHRLGECELTREEREGNRGCPGWLLRKGRVSVWDPLFSRGVPALPRIPPPPPSRVVRELVAGEKGDEELAAGDVYTDGALQGRWRRIMRAGWGVVVLVPGELKVSWKMHGTCPDIYPSILRAELTAVLNALRVAMPPLRIHVDNAEVVKGFQQGERWCLAPDRDGGDLWREVWVRMGELAGVGVVEVVKVKAHTEAEEVDEGVITERDRFGNLHADAEAKRGARLAESLAPAGVARGELVKALRWLGWARRLAAVWQQDAAGDQEGGERASRAGDGQMGPRKGTGLRHLIWERGVAWMCRRCGRVADTDLKRKDMRSSRCQGSAVGRLLSRTCNDPEAVGRSCVERKADLASRGWRPKEGEGQDDGTDPRWQPVREFDEEGDDFSGSEVEAVREDRGTGNGAGMGGRAAADPAAAASSGSGSASAQRGDPSHAHQEGEGCIDSSPIGSERGSGGLGLPAAAVSELAAVAVGAASGGGIAAASSRGCRPGEAVEDDSSSGEHPGAPPRPAAWATAGPPRVAPGRRLTTKAWKRDPDWLYSSYIGVAAKEAAAMEAAASLAAADATMELPAGLEPLQDWPELPAEEARAVLAEWEAMGKRRRTGDPMESGRQAPAAVVDTSTAMSAPSYEESFMEDPFGYVAEELAAQSPLRGGPREALSTDGMHRAASSRAHLPVARAGHECDPLGRDPRPRDGDQRRGATGQREEGQDSPVSRKRPLGEAHSEAGAAEGGPEEKRIRTADEGAGSWRSAASEQAVGQRRYGRRYSGVHADPVDAADASGHRLVITGPLIWCERCGRYASRRVGRALKGGCVGEATGAYATRLRRMREGLHPLTGAALLA